MTTQTFSNDKLNTNQCGQLFNITKRQKNYIQHKKKEVEIIKEASDKIKDRLFNKFTSV